MLSLTTDCLSLTIPYSDVSLQAPQLRIALLDYLKADKEVLPLVALRFCLYREIGESHETSAKRQLNQLKNELNANNLSMGSAVKHTMDNAMDELVDAYHSYKKAGCYSHAEKCAKWARLVALQISWLELKRLVLHMDYAQVEQLVENHDNFNEVCDHATAQLQ